MSSLKSFMLYDGLPIKSGGGHHLNRLNNDEILDSIIGFISKYTDSKAANVTVSMIQFNWRSFFKYCFRFGFPQFAWWNYWAIKENLVSWKASPDLLKDKINVILADENLLLAITWRFYFVNPETGLLLLNQKEIPIIDERKPRSEVYLRLSNLKKTASVWFTLPFEDLNESNLQYIKAMEQALPFKFSSKNWRVYRYSKNGNWFSRKLD